MIGITLEIILVVLFAILITKAIPLMAALDNLTQAVTALGTQVQAATAMIATLGPADEAALTALTSQISSFTTQLQTAVASKTVPAPTTPSA